MINEVYILDSDFNTLGVIDEFVSCIWTERYSNAGDFELYCPVNEKTTALLYRPADDYSDRYAMIKDSDTYMVIENVLLTTDTEDGDRYTVTGRSIESLLDRRVIWDKYVAENATVESIVQDLIAANVTQPTDSDRYIGLFMPEDEQWFSSTSVNAKTALKIAEYYGDNLYDVITELCSAYHIGFRAVPFGNNKFQLQLYDGADRTYNQLENPYVVFSEKLDNLLESRWQKNTADYRNYVLVRGDADYDPVFLDGDALLLANAQEQAELYQESMRHIRELEQDIVNTEQRVYDLKIRLAELYNLPDSEANQYEREAIEQELDHTEIWRMREALVSAENDYKLWKYYTDLQEKLGDPNKQKMMLCSPVDPVSGLDRREMWVDDSTELEKSAETLALEEQNESLHDQIQQIWADYWNAAVNGQAHDDLDTVEAQVAELESQIRSNKQLIEAQNKQTLDAYYSHLTETGRLAMAEHSVTTSFDGTVDASVQFKFGKDFFLGDLVQIRNAWGMEAVTRVTEVMRSRDESGDSVVPTFVSD